MLSEQGETPCKLAIKKPISFPNASADPAKSDKGKTREGRRRERDRRRERQKPLSMPVQFSDSSS